MPTSNVVLQLPVTNFPSGTHRTSTRAVPAGFQDSLIQMTGATTGNPASPFQGIANPFSSAVITVVFGLEWSWDGGTSFPESTQSTLAGNAQGQWPAAKGTTMTPTCDLGMPFNSSLGGSPTHYRAFATVNNGPVTTGLTVTETTNP